MHSIAVTKFRKCFKFCFTVEIYKFNSTLERTNKLLSYKKSSKYKYLFLYTISLTESIGCQPISHLLFFLIAVILESVQVNCPQPQVKNPKLSFSISSIVIPLATDWSGSSTRLGSIIVDIRESLMWHFWEKSFSLKKKKERERLTGKEETFMINIHLFLVFVGLFITDLYFKYSSLKWLQPFYRKK